MFARLRFATALFLVSAAFCTSSLAGANTLPIARPARGGFAVGTPGGFTGIRPANQTVLFAQDFTHSASIANAWAYGGDACLTAGYSATPSTSIHPCGSQAPSDKGGSGALQLTPPANWQQGYAIWRTPVPTSAGLIATFNYYSYNSSGTFGDGLALIIADASLEAPSLGGCCGSLDYAPYIQSGQQPQAGLASGYLAVALDESGWWTSSLNGKLGGPTSPYPNIISVRGSAQSGWNFLTSSTNSSGQPAPLPFNLTAGSSRSRPIPLTVSVLLTATGTLAVAVDRHNGAGPIVYLQPTMVAGLFHEPAVPAFVYLGFAAANGGSNERHQINEVLVTTAN